MYCCLLNFGRCGQSQDRVWFNCPLDDPFYPAEWMAETHFFAQLITLLDIDGIGQNWEDSNTVGFMVAGGLQKRVFWKNNHPVAATGVRPEGTPARRW